MAGQKQDEFGSTYADNLFGKTAADDEIAKGRSANLKIKPGETKVIRMISSKVEVKTHWKVLPNAGRIICRKTLGKDEDCPICSYLEQTRAKEGWASWRCYARIIDYTDDLVKQWDFSFATKEAIFDAIRNSDKVSAENPLSKFKIQIKRVGAGLETVYKITIAKTPSELTVEEKALVTQLKPMEDGFKVLAVSELRGLITGESAPVIREEVTTQEVALEEKKEQEPKADKEENLF